MPLNSTPCTINAARVRPQARRARSGVDHRLRAVGRAGAGSRRATWRRWPTAASSASRRSCATRACRSFRAPTTRRCSTGMREAARLGLPVAVHAESEELTRGAGARMTGRDVARLPRLAAGRRRARGDPARAAASPRRPAPGCTSSTSARAAAWRWPPRRARAASTCRSKPARTTCSSPTRISSGSARSPSARRRCGRPTSGEALWAALLARRRRHRRLRPLAGRAGAEAGRLRVGVGRHRRRAVDAGGAARARASRARRCRSSASSTWSPRRRPAASASPARAGSPSGMRRRSRARRSRGVVYARRGAICTSGIR